MFETSLSFRSFIPLLLLPIVPVLSPVFAFYRCRIGHTIVKLKLFITCPEIIGPQEYSPACSWLYCLLLYCTLYNSVHVLKLTLQTSLLFPFKWVHVPIA